MASAGTVTLELDANSVKLIRELQKAQKQTKTSANSMQRNMTQAFSKIRGGANIAVKALSKMAIGAATASAAIFKLTASSIDELAKTSDRLGIATEDLQALRFAAEQTGAGAAGLDRALSDMTRRLGEAKGGTGEAIKGIEALGLSVSDLLSMDPAEQFRMIAGAMSNVGTQAEKNAIAYQIFGRQGQQLVNTLAVGREGLDQFAQQARDLGLSLSRVDAAKVEAANDAMNRVRIMLTGVAQQYTVQLSPVVEAFSNQIIESTKDYRDFGTTVLDTSESIAIGFAFIGNSIRGWQLIITSIKFAFAKMFEFFIVIQRNITQLFEDMINNIIDNINTLLFYLEKVGVSVDFIPLITIRHVDTLNNIIEKSTGYVKEFGDELQDLAIRPMPTDNVRSFFNEIRKRIIQASNVTDIAPKVTVSGEFVSDEGPSDDMKKLQQSIASIASATRTQAEKIKADIELVKQAIEAGLTQPFIDAGTTAEEVMNRLNEKLKEVEQPLDEMTEFGKAAAQNLQSSFADFLFDPFENGVKGMLVSFANLIRRMIAEAAAAKILQQLFGGLAGSSNAFLSSIGGAFVGPTAAPAVPGVRDVGGRGEAGKPYIINPKAGPELFIPKTAGEFIPNIDEMGGGMNLNLTIDARDAGAEARIKDMIIREMVPQIISAAKQDTIRTLRRPRFA